MKDFVIEIKREKFIVEEPVFNLILALSKERDLYFNLLEHTHTLCNKSLKNYHRFQEVEDALQAQRNYKTGQN